MNKSPEMYSTYAVMTPEKSNVPKAQKTNERTALQKHRYLLLHMYFMVTMIRLGRLFIQD